MTPAAERDLIAVRRRQRQDRAYEELRAVAPDLYRECVHTAGAIAINHDLGSNASAEIEAALVELALRLTRDS